MKRNIARKLFVTLLLTALAANVLLPFPVNTSANTTEPSPIIDLKEAVVTAKTASPWGKVDALKDGDLTTRYISDGGYPLDGDLSVDEWIIVDLGKVYTVDQVGFVAYSTGSGSSLPDAFTIQTSLTGEEDSWTVQYTNDSITLVGGVYPVDDPKNSAYFFTFPKVDTRYIKLHITKIKAATSLHEVSLRELLIYGKEKEEEASPLPKLIWSELSQASVSVSSANQWTPAERLINGNLNWTDIWLSAGGATDVNVNEWVQIDLGAPYILDKFAFNGYEGNKGTGLPVDFTIQVSMTGEPGNWTTVYTNTGINPYVGVYYQFSFSRVNAQYIRLNITKIGDPYQQTNYEVVLTEVEVYGEKMGEIPEQPDERSPGNVKPINPTTEKPADDLTVILPSGKLDFSAYLGGRKGNTGIPGWDPDGWVIATSKSLEVGWSKGYGKGFLIDKDSGEWSTSGVYMSAMLEDDNITVTVNETKNVEEWVALNMQKPYPLRRFSFTSLYKGTNHGFPEDFKIMVSNDGENWSTVVSRTGYKPMENTSTYIFDFEEVNCQYICLFVTKIAGICDSNLRYSLGLTEIAAYLGDTGLPDPIDPPKGQVVVKEDGRIDLSSYLEGRSASQIPGWDPGSHVVKVSDSLEAGWSNGYGKGFLIDGVVKGTYPVTHGMFLADSQAPHSEIPEIDSYIQLNLQQVFTVDKIMMGGHRYADDNGFPTDFTIEVSMDGENWTVVYEAVKYWPGFNSTEHFITFDPVECQYVKLHVTKLNAPYDPTMKYTLALSEFAVYEHRPE